MMLIKYYLPDKIFAKMIYKNFGLVVMFIVFEGIEASGKSTQAKLLADFLKSMGKDVVLTREPGGTDVGKAIRQILLNPKNQIPPIAELLLYEADRNIHVNNLIKPALEEGKIVISDRYIYSTLAYQGYARGLDKNLIKTLNQLVIQGLKPDIVFLLDIPVSVSLERLGKTRDRIERESVDFHERLREGFLKIAEEEKDRFIVVDATKPVEDIFNQIKAEVMKRLK